MLFDWFRHTEIITLRARVGHTAKRGCSAKKRAKRRELESDDCVQRNGRLVGTRTPDLHRVKVAL